VLPSASRGFKPHLPNFLLMPRPKTSGDSSGTAESLHGMHDAEMGLPALIRNDRGLGQSSRSYRFSSMPLSAVIAKCMTDSRT
jgi:hypothetical protein